MPAMMLKWFNAREAADLGSALADQFAAAARQPAPTRGSDGKRREHASALEELHERADREVRPLDLNFYQKARFANAFKWKLIENGVESGVADGVTQSLILHLSRGRADATADRGWTEAQAAKAKDPGRTGALFMNAEKALSEGHYARAAELFDEYVSLVPGRADALNALGVSLYNLGRYQEAEQRYREALDIDPQYANALVNLAALLQANPKAAEPLLRRVLKINPKYPGARAMLGIMLLSSSRDHEATLAFRKALKVSPKDPIALLGLAQIARVEGRFDDAEALLKRTLEISPKMPTAWAALNATRKMTTADSGWFATAEEIAGSGIQLWEESQLRFAMGKYCDDIEDYEQAFANYRRGNTLLKSVAGAYDREAHSSFADDMTRTLTRETLASIKEGGSASEKPVFVVGMPRSGTSLTEQIIASHPAAGGVGEPDYWLEAARAHHDEIRRAPLALPVRKKLAEDYLHLIERRCPSVQRIVDKTPANSDFVGFIRTVFPNARIIRMRRNPIDTCLSCYFQNFSTGMAFTMDLNDLADYYRIHQRVMNHWCNALPPEAILDVPYEELVSDQETWTRKILDFVGLEWDERCLAFHETKRSVVTASAWQVRQKIYRQSVERWRHYEKFIGPLKGLRD
jgi:tetratricopeptide (TPR) repeat protein